MRHFYTEDGLQGVCIEWQHDSDHHSTINVWGHDAQAYFQELPHHSNSMAFIRGQSTLKVNSETPSRNCPGEDSLAVFTSESTYYAPPPSVSETESATEGSENVLLLQSAFSYRSLVYDGVGPNFLTRETVSKFVPSVVGRRIQLQNSPTFRAFPIGSRIYRRTSVLDTIFYIVETSVVYLWE